MLKDMLSNNWSLGRSLGAESNLAITDVRSKRFLWALFAFFYIPLIYYYGCILPPSIGIDYPSYFHAARFVFIEGKIPYGLDAFNGITGHIGGKVQPYIYPPPSLLAFWPLAKLSTENARLAFLTASHLAYLSSIWLILFRLTPLPRDERLRAIVLGLSLIYMLCSFSALDTLATGQINFVALMFICLALAALRQKAPSWQIALPLSIAIVLKTYPVLLLLPLLFRRRFRAIIYTCFLFAAFAAFATLVLPAHIWRSWFIEVLPLGGYANNRIPAAFCWNQSINAFVMRLFQEEYFSKAPLPYPLLAKPVATALVSLVIGATVFFSFRASRQLTRETRGDEDIAAFLLMIYLIAPLSWDHHLVYIFPAGVLAISLLGSGQIQGKSSVIIAAALLLLAWRIPIDRLDITRSWWTLLMSAKLYPVIVLWLFFLHRLHKMRYAVISFNSCKTTAFQNATGGPEANLVS
jgi:alpha-1,2-mannosyltransferase